MASKDVFVVLVHDLHGGVIVDSIHHQFVGRGETYSKVGAWNRANELQRKGLVTDVKRLPTGARLAETYTVKKL